MDEKKLFSVVIMQLNLDYIKSESKLEVAINENIDIGKKTKKITKLLSKMVMIEKSIAKFSDMMTNNNELIEK